MTPLIGMTGTTGAAGIIGIATVVLSLAAKASLLGQIRLNHRRRSVDGLHILFYAVGLASYASYTLLGAVDRNWFLAIGQGPGVVLMGTIGVQWLAWRKKR